MGGHAHRGGRSARACETVVTVQLVAVGTGDEAAQVVTHGCTLPLRCVETSCYSAAAFARARARVCVCVYARARVFVCLCLCGVVVVVCVWMAGGWGWGRGKE